ncbi:MAG: PEGA domain-containing protein [Deltaproteobacteria bacterium]|nr:PEGA domain-containing protein [Deltaproteobacteria bacterium]
MLVFTPVVRSCPWRLLAFALVATCLANTAWAKPAVAPPAPQRRVVVLPLGSLGVDDSEAASLLGFLRAEIAKLPGVMLVDLSKHGKLVGADCRGEEKCLGAAGAKLGAEVVIAGTVAGVGEAYSIDLKAILTRTGHEDTRITEVISGERELLIDGVRGAAYKLLLPSQYAGTIQLELAEEGAEVFVDGRPVGKTPLKTPIPSLTPGKHALKIVKAGFADFDKWVDVRFARVSVVKVDLRNSAITGVMFEKEGQAGLAPVEADAAQVQGGIFTGQRVGALVVGALGVLLVGGGFYFGDAAQTERDAANAIPRPVEGGGVESQSAPEARGRLAAMSANAIAADAAWVLGGCAVAAGVVLWFTGGHSTAAPVVAVGPDGASVGIVGSF